MMVRVLITGANRGLGLEFVKQLLNRGDTVIATFREPNDLSNLNNLKNTFRKCLKILSLDVSSSDSRNQAFKNIKEQFEYIDILINNAGTTGKRYLTLGYLYTDDMSEVFNVNAISPLLMVETFLELLENSSNPKVINITSRMGSISLRQNTNNFSYCASKSALNMFSKLLSNSLRSKSIIVIPMHPGWVKTRMGTQQAPLSVQESISGMLNVIDNLNLDQTGQFFDWQGNIVPW